MTDEPNSPLIPVDKLLDSFGGYPRGGPVSEKLSYPKEAKQPNVLDAYKPLPPVMVRYIQQPEGGTDDAQVTLWEHVLNPSRWPVPDAGDVLVRGTKSYVVGWRRFVYDLDRNLTRVDIMTVRDRSSHPSVTDHKRSHAVQDPQTGKWSDGPCDCNP